MTLWFALPFIAPALLLLIPATILFIEVLAAAVGHEHIDESLTSRTRRLAVIVPAHNEGQGLVPTLYDLAEQIGPQDRIIVVADNCTDDTEAVARGAGIEATKKAGVEVIARHDAERIGKGYALDWGIRHLALDPPDLVMFCDADCRLAPALIGQLAAECEALDAPVQACYLMKRSVDSPRQSFAEFAWTVKNLVRPLGLRRLNGPCQLVGTGMMFPWRVIQNAPLASGNLVEDLQLGIELAIAGAAARFVPRAIVTSSFPTTRRGADTQRLRWIQGYLATLKNELPRLLRLAIKRRDMTLLLLALDLAVPPLLLFAALVLGALLLAGIGVLLGLGAWMALPATLNVMMLGAAISLAWFRFGPAFRWGGLVAVLGVALASSALFLQLLRGRKASAWVRTERTGTDVPSKTPEQPSGHADVIERG